LTQLRFLPPQRHYGSIPAVRRELSNWIAVAEPMDDDAFTRSAWNEADLSILAGWEAQVWDYSVSHGSLSIRFHLDHPDKLRRERFLLCFSCKSLPQRTHWTVDSLEVVRQGETNTVLDRTQGISFDCDCTALLGVRSFQDWNGGLVREITISRQGNECRGELFVFQRVDVPDRAVSAFWIRPCHKDPVHIDGVDALDALQRCLAALRREIDLLRRDGTEIWWKSRGDNCGLWTVTSDEPPG
jgi:hypothetical protein